MADEKEKFVLRVERLKPEAQKEGEEGEQWKNQKDAQPAIPQILTVGEAAQILRTGEGFVRTLIKKGKMRAYKEGRRGGYRIFAEEIESYIRKKFEESN